MPTAFRTDESYQAEEITRGMLASFLRERGFTDVRDHRQRYGQNQDQAIRAIDEEGRPVVMGTRLCWRDKRGKSDEHIAAAQLLSRVADGDWNGSLTRKVEREQKAGKTHLLVVKRAGNSIVQAASIPLEAVLPIWTTQRDVSQGLIDRGQLGKRKKDHARNGDSPTLWLRDDSAPGVAAALWDWPGVRDLV